MQLTPRDLVCLGTVSADQWQGQVSSLFLRAIGLVVVQQPSNEPDTLACRPLAPRASASEDQSPLVQIRLALRRLLAQEPELDIIGETCEVKEINHGE